MSETRYRKKYRRERNEVTQGKVAIAYEGPASDVFVEGAFRRLCEQKAHKILVSRNSARHLKNIENNEEIISRR